MLSHVSPQCGDGIELRRRTTANVKTLKRCLLPVQGKIEIYQVLSGRKGIQTYKHGKNEMRGKMHVILVWPFNIKHEKECFKSRLSLIVRVNVVVNRTVVADSNWRFDNLCGSHLQSQSELHHVSWWYYTLVIDLIGQLCRDVIGRLSVKPWCYWLWRLVM